MGKITKQEESGGIGWMQGINMLNQITNSNAANNYSSSFSAVTDPASFLYNQGMLGWTKEQKRQRKMDEEKQETTVLQNKLLKQQISENEDRIKRKRKLRQLLMGYK